MAIFRRIKDRVTEFGKTFDQPEWKAGYQFEGIYHENGADGEPLIEQLIPARIHLASSCEEVKNGGDTNS